MQSERRDTIGFLALYRDLLGKNCDVWEILYNLIEVCSVWRISEAMRE